MSRITRDIEALWGANRPRHAHCDPLRMVRLRLRRHCIPVVARFRHSLVVTYAFPETLLQPLLPPGLDLDTHSGMGFVAIALVQTEDLRPVFLPRFLGQNFFLIGYRIFVRHRTRTGRCLRGLRILRSETDRRLMVVAGNLLTHYNYQKVQAMVREKGPRFDVHVSTSDGLGDLRLHANLQDRPVAPPAGSPFRNWHQARLFAGPLPFTFDYEPETGSLIRIEGVRRVWNPQPVTVESVECRRFEREPFCRAQPLLANAFHVANVDYRWNRGVVESLDQLAIETPTAKFA